MRFLPMAKYKTSYPYKTKVNDGMNRTSSIKFVCFVWLLSTNECRQTRNPLMTERRLVQHPMFTDQTESCHYFDDSIPVSLGETRAIYRVVTRNRSILRPKNKGTKTLHELGGENVG